MSDAATALINDKDELLRTAKLLDQVTFSAARARKILQQVTESVLRRFNEELIDQDGTSLVTPDSTWKSNAGFARHLSKSWLGWLEQDPATLSEAFNEELGDVARLEKQITGWSLARVFLCSKEKNAPTFIHADIFKKCISIHFLWDG